MEENLIEKLVGAFMSLSGVGYKTAQRYAYQILDSDEETAKNLAHCILEAKQKVKTCKECGNFSSNDICEICATRNSKIICVVKEPKDINCIEKVKNFDCVYHVLHGCISPLENKGPNDIRIKELLIRIQKQDYSEVIVATNPDVQGEATAMYIAKLLKPLGLKVTRLAQGISMGSELEYADEVTLTKAIEGRREI